MWKVRFWNKMWYEGDGRHPDEQQIGSDLLQAECNVVVLLWMKGPIIPKIIAQMPHRWGRRKLGRGCWTGIAAN